MTKRPYEAVVVDLFPPGLNRPPALYRLMEKTHTGEKKASMGFFMFGKAHTGPLYGFLPLADIGQVIY